MNSLELKRKFLIVIADEKQGEAMAQSIGRHIANASFVHAKDGSEAMLKIQNDPPHVVLTEEDLAKTSGTKLIEAIVTDRALQETAAILLSPIPDKEQFVDEVVKGRVQFLTKAKDDALLAKALSRALNYLTTLGSDTEFHMRFLAIGDQLIKQGEKAKSVYIVKRGQLKAHIQDDKQQDVTLGQIEPGEFVGEMAYINGEPRSANVTALSDCELIEIPIDRLDQLLFQKPSWSKALMITLSKRISRANQRITE